MDDPQHKMTSYETGAEPPFSPVLTNHTEHTEGNHFCELQAVDTVLNLCTLWGFNYIKQNSEIFTFFSHGIRNKTKTDKKPLRLAIK